MYIGTKWMSAPNYTKCMMEWEWENVHDKRCHEGTLMCYKGTLMCQSSKSNFHVHQSTKIPFMCVKMTTKVLYEVYFSRTWVIRFFNDFKKMKIELRIFKYRIRHKKMPKEKIIHSYKESHDYANLSNVSFIVSCWKVISNGYNLWNDINITLRLYKME